MMITTERLIHLLADCNYLPGQWDKRFVHDMERKLDAPNFNPTEKQLAQLHRIAWNKRKQLTKANFYPPETWKGETEERRVSDDVKKKFDAWSKSVASNNIPPLGRCILCGCPLEVSGICQTCRNAENDA